MTNKGKAKGGSTAVKTRKKKKGTGKPLTIIQYNALRQAYFEDQNVRRAARIVGIALTTAQRYVNGKAAPHRGMAPIRERWVQAQAESQDRQDLTHIEFQAKVLELVKGGLEAVKGEVYLVQQDIKLRAEKYQRLAREAKAKDEEIPLPQLTETVKGLTSALMRLAMIGEKQYTGLDARVGIVGGPDALKGITDDQAMRMIETGLFPDEVDRMGGTSSDEED